MEHPRGLLGGVSRAALTENGVVTSKDLSLHEQVAEGAMGQIGIQGRHHHLGVARHLDRAGPVGQVGQGDATDLDVVTQARR